MVRRQRALLLALSVVTFSLSAAPASGLFDDKVWSTKPGDWVTIATTTTMEDGSVTRAEHTFTFRGLNAHGQRLFDKRDTRKRGVKPTTHASFLFADDRRSAPTAKIVKRGLTVKLAGAQRRCDVVDVSTRRTPQCGNDPTKFWEETTRSWRCTLKGGRLATLKRVRSTTAYPRQGKPTTRQDWTEEAEAVGVTLKLGKRRELNCDVLRKTLTQGHVIKRWVCPSMPGGVARTLELYAGQQLRGDIAKIEQRIVAYGKR